MDPESIDQITAAVVGAGALVSVAVGFMKKFGGSRFVLARKFFGAFARLIAALDKRLS